MTPAPTRLAGVARRLGCTEGQFYTVTIGLAVALLLLSFGSRANFTPVPAAEAAVSPAAPRGDAATEVLPDLTVSGALPPLGLPSLSPVAPLPPAAGDGPAAPTPGGSTPPAPSPCAGDATQQTVRPVLDALEGTGVVPSDSVLALIGVATGCNKTDPVVVALGLVAEFGSGIPDPGFSLPVVPVPFVELPAGVIAAVQPLRPALDPICDAVGSVVTVIVYGFATYPLGIDSAMLTAVNQVLLACGQIRD